MHSETPILDLETPVQILPPAADPSALSFVVTAVWSVAGILPIADLVLFGTSYFWSWVVLCASPIVLFAVHTAGRLAAVICLGWNWWPSGFRLTFVSPLGGRFHTHSPLGDLIAPLPRRTVVRRFEVAIIAAAGPFAALLPLLVLFAEWAQRVPLGHRFEFCFAVGAFFVCSAIPGELPRKVRDGAEPVRSAGRDVLDMLGKRGRARCALLELLGKLSRPDALRASDAFLIGEALDNPVCEGDRGIAHICAFVWAARFRPDVAQYCLENALASCAPLPHSCKSMLFTHAAVTQLLERGDVARALEWLKLRIDLPNRTREELIDAARTSLLPMDVRVTGGKRG